MEVSIQVSHLDELDRDNRERTSLTQLVSLTGQSDWSVKGSAYVWSPGADHIPCHTDHFAGG